MLLISSLVVAALATAVLSVAVQGAGWLLALTAMLVVAAFVSGRTKTHRHL